MKKIITASKVASIMKNYFIRKKKNFQRIQLVIKWVPLTTLIHFFTISSPEPFMLYYVIARSPQQSSDWRSIESNVSEIESTIWQHLIILISNMLWVLSFISLWIYLLNRRISFLFNFLSYCDTTVSLKIELTLCFSVFR